jgi:hypothetical protein
MGMFGKNINHGVLLSCGQLGVSRRKRQKSSQNSVSSVVKFLLIKELIL